MVTVTTTRFGEILVNDADVITLPEGLVGFPEYTRYALLDHDKESPFKWLQSLDEGAIAFTIIDPTIVRPNYQVAICEAKQAVIDLADPADAIIATIVTMPTNPQNMTVNLKAPLVFNLKNRLGIQVILTDSDYSTRHNVMDEMRAQMTDWRI